jgi:hypothetical protein
MARPTKFNPDQGQVIVEALRSGLGRRAAVEAAGVGLRTLAEWIAKGRAGDPAFRPWVAQVDQAEGVARRRRVNAQWARYRIEGRERWKRFGASREAWYLEKLGPARFWSRRLQWLADHGKGQAYAATVAKLEAEGFRINRTP